MSSRLAMTLVRIPVINGIILAKFSNIGMVLNNSDSEW
jgi:hypothetical protein